MSTELVIYTDESDKSGKYYSNFYGGVLVSAKHLESVIQNIEDCKADHNLFGEIKWQKVTSNYLDKYIEVMNVFFDEVKQNKIKTRIMFTSNQYIPQNLTSEQKRNEYHLLYYQFLKHSFGLEFSHLSYDSPINIRLNIDQMPSNHEYKEQFKSYLVGLNQNPRMRNSGVRFNRENIAEVSSHDHVLMQCLDVVMGANVFRLNDKHKVKRPGKRTRGKRTIAKEKLYKHINNRIRSIFPNFNIGISTGTHGDPTNRWNHAYRHWLLIPGDHVRNKSLGKQKNDPELSMPVMAYPKWNLGLQKHQGLIDYGIDCGLSQNERVLLLHEI